MSKKKKACSGAASPKQAAERNGQGSLRLHNSTFEGPLSRFLSYGAEQGKKARELERLTGWDARSINEIADLERRQGVPILSDTYNGYYLPGTEEDKLIFVRRMRHRAEEILATAAAVERGPMA